jgi:hypothetical protein
VTGWNVLGARQGLPPECSPNLMLSGTEHSSDTGAPFHTSHNAYSSESGIIFRLLT